MSDRSTNIFAHVLQGPLSGLPAANDPSIELRTMYELSDGSGMYYLAAINGVKTWVFIASATPAALAAGFKSPVLAATVAALPAYTVSADKQTLTANANGAFPTVDGVTVPVGASFLLDTGAADADNGIYVLTAAGGAGAPFVATRRADSNSAGSITQQSRVVVQQGALYAGQTFGQATAAPIVIGTTPQAWQSIAQPTYYVNTATGSDANSGSAAAPFATYAHARAVVAPGQIATINLAAGQTFALPAGTSSLPFGASVLTTSPYASQLGARTAAAGSTTRIVNDAAGGLAVNASRGDRIRFTSGANAGLTETIRANDAVSFTVFNALPNAPAAGDAFVVERGSATITWGAATTLAVGGDLDMYDAVQFASTANAQIIWVGGQVRFRGYHIDVSTFGAAISFKDCDLVFGSLLPGGAPGGAAGQREAGGAMIGLVSSFSSLNLYATRAVATSIALTGEIVGPNTSTFELDGFDAINTTFPTQSSSALLLYAPSDFGSASTITGANHTSDAVSAQSESAVSFSKVDISNWSGNGVQIGSNSYGLLTTVTGTGNTGAGVYVLNAGVLYAGSGNTITGATGQLTVDGRTGLTLVAGVNRSSAALSGTQICFGGGFTGGAGTTTAYFAPGLPLVANNSTTAIRQPMSPGRLAQNLRMSVLSNALTTATVFTLLKAPVGTNTPAATAITLSVTALTLVNVTDLAHVVQYQDGDQYDLQATNSGGGANPFTFTASLQAA